MADNRTNQQPSISSRVARDSPPPSREIPAWLDRVQTHLNLDPPDPVRKIFLERAFEALIEISKNLPSGTLEETAAQRSDLLVLFRALRSPELLPELEQYEPLASPYLRGLEAQQELLKRAGGMMTGEEVANMLGISRQAVDKRRQAQKLIAIPQGQRGFGYPVCQFEARGPVPGLEQMLRSLAADGWSQLTFLLSPNSALEDRTPLEVLGQGHVAAVIEAASVFGEHGAH